jgi:hypothetical protein
MLGFFAVFRRKMSAWSADLPVEGQIAPAMLGFFAVFRRNRSVRSTKLNLNSARGRAERA